jgi:uncharacterized protein YjbI with pentapeptide repeats
MLRRRVWREPEAGGSMTSVSDRTLVVGMLAVAVAGGDLAVWLLSAAPAHPDGGGAAWIGLARAALSLVVGAAAAVGLWLALRQRSADVRAVNTMKLTIERRVNEIIAEAGDQLGSDTASIRLTGLYALERLAQTYPGHRQVVVNALCAYLQAPWTPPGGVPVARSDGSDKGLEIEHDPAAQDGTQPKKCPQPAEDQMQEHRVRRTAQWILLRHLAKEAPHQQRWESMIDLSGAYLGGASLYEADLRVAVLAGADLTNADLHDTDLRRADLRRVNLAKADLMHACLTGANLEQASLHMADLAWANLNGARLSCTNLTGANLRGANLAAADLVEADLSAVYWTKETIWPLRLQREILEHSTEVQTAAGEVALLVRSGYRVA